MILLREIRRAVARALFIVACVVALAMFWGCATKTTTAPVVVHPKQLGCYGKLEGASIVLLCVPMKGDGS